MKHLFWGIFLSLCVTVQAKEINAKYFGAIPNDGKDDTKALRKAAAFCRENPKTTLYNYDRLFAKTVFDRKSNCCF
ncbi:MAG: hypothetical protein ACRDCN_10205 [Tannerellaceae bacterium]